MGWAHCGTDSAGQPVGYWISDSCDDPSCAGKVVRGLAAYVCEGAHGQEKYFCSWHLRSRYDPEAGRTKQLCGDCCVPLDQQRDRELIDALAEIAAGADPVETARAVLERWNET